MTVGQVGFSSCLRLLPLPALEQIRLAQRVGIQCPVCCYATTLHHYPSYKLGRGGLHGPCRGKGHTQCQARRTECLATILLVHWVSDDRPKAGDRVTCNQEQACGEDIEREVVLGQLGCRIARGIGTVCL